MSFVDKMWRQKISFFYLLVLVSSDERNKEYNDESRKGRLFTFNTVDDDIKLELQFSIPFISIPTKKAIDSVHGLWPGTPSININPATLAVGGAIVLGTTIFLPFVLKSYANHHSHHGYSRLLDSAKFSTDGLLDFAGHMFSKGEFVQACSLRVACWIAQSSKMNHARTLREMMSNTLISTVINSTAIEDAMLSGRKGRDCSTYAPCPLKEEHIPIIFSNLATLTNSIG